MFTRYVQFCTVDLGTCSSWLNKLTEVLYAAGSSTVTLAASAMVCTWSTTLATLKPYLCKERVLGLSAALVHAP
jgi:hypothetical protein